MNEVLGNGKHFADGIYTISKMFPRTSCRFRGSCFFIYFLFVLIPSKKIEKCYFFPFSQINPSPSNDDHPAPIRRDGYPLYLGLGLSPLTNRFLNFIVSIEYNQPLLSSEPKIFSNLVGREKAIVFSEEKSKYR